MESKGNMFVDFKSRLSANAPPIYLGKLKGEVAGKAEIAVKHIMYTIGREDNAKREINALIKLRTSRNIVGYKCHQLDAQTGQIFVGIELCRDGSLRDFDLRNNGLSISNRRNMVLHIMNGLYELHDKGFTHGYLKLSNILQSSDGKSIKIGGFGLDTRQARRSFSISSSAGDSGSPEHYLNIDKSEKSDIFSAGIILHHILSGGTNPFGKSKTDIRKNICNGTYKLSLLHDLPNLIFAENLIKWMLQPVQEHRPTALNVLRHPFFWSDETKEECANRMKTFWTKLPEDLKQKIRRNREELKHVGNMINLEQSLFLYICILSHKAKLKIEIEEIEEIEEFQNKENLLQILEEIPISKLPVFHLDLHGIDFTKDNSTLERDLEDLTLHEIARDAGDGDALDQPFRLNGLEPVVEGKEVYEGTLTGLVEESVVVKFLPDTAESLASVQIYSDCNSGNRNVLVQLKQSSRHVWRERTMLCILMQPYNKTPFVSLTLMKNFSFQVRVEACKHILKSVFNLHRNGVVHQNIGPEKFLLSCNGNYVNMISSRMMKRGTTNEERKNDLQATAKVIWMILNRKSLSMEKLHDFNCIDYSAIYSLADDKPLLLDLMKKMWTGNSTNNSLTDFSSHAFFWDPEKKMNFLVAVSDHYQSRIGELDAEMNQRHWIQDLKLCEHEVRKWYEDDSYGVVYLTATSDAGNYRDRSIESLLRLIKNCKQDLLTDIIDSYKKSTGRMQNDVQTLFKSFRDVGIFFYERFSDVFHETYKHIRKTNSPDFIKYFENSQTQQETVKALDLDVTI